MRLPIVSCITFTLVSTLWVAAQAETDPAKLPANLEVERASPPPADKAARQSEGPPLWKATHPNGNVLWILGTVNPKPKRLKWRSDAIDRAVAGSQLVLRQSNEMPAGINVELYTLDPLQHMRAALHEESLEDKRDSVPLKQVLPPELYGRFEKLKTQYLRRSNSIEKQSPLAAANRLYNAAIDDADLSTLATIHNRVESVARKHGIDIEDIALEIKVNLRTAMEIETERSKRPLTADIPCMQATIEQLETQLPAITARAQAWANGDLNALRQLPNLTRDACNYAPWNTPRWKDLPQRLAQHWLDTVNAAAIKHRATFVMIDIGLLLKPDGLLTALESKGYRVESP
jgi:uncharacterized protein YbaP (TraB family)